MGEYVVGDVVGDGVGGEDGSGVGLLVGSGVPLHTSGLHTGPQGPSANSLDTRLHASLVSPPFVDST